MNKNNAIKNRIKIIAIIVLVLAIATGTFIAFYNFKINNIKVLAKITDVEGKISKKEVILKATKNKDGSYNIQLPSNIDTNYVTEFFTEDNNKIEYDGKEQKNFIITKEELEKGEINLQTRYDTQIVTIENNEQDKETATLYNKKLEYNNGELTVEGYMPLNSELKVEKTELTENETQKVENIDKSQKLSVAVYEKVEAMYKDLENLNTEAKEEQFVEYNPGKFGKELTLKTSEDKIILKNNNTRTLEQSNEDFIKTTELAITNPKTELIVEETETQIEDVNKIGTMTGNTMTTTVGENITQVKIVAKHEHIHSSTCSACSGTRTCKGRPKKIDSEAEKGTTCPACERTGGIQINTYQCPVCGFTNTIRGCTYSDCGWMQGDNTLHSSQPCTNCNRNWNNNNLGKNLFLELEFWR